MKKKYIFGVTFIFVSQILLGTHPLPITNEGMVTSMRGEALGILLMNDTYRENASETIISFFEEVNHDTFVVACALLERESCFEQLRAIEHQQDLILFRKKYIPDGEDFTELFNELVVEEKQFEERVEMIEAFIIERITSPKD